MCPGTLPEDPVKSNTFKNQNIMISKTETLGLYLQQFRDGGLDLGVFPSQSGKRFTLRVVDPDEPETGLTFVASFAKSVEEADIPENRSEAIKASRALDAMLHDTKQTAQYCACYCIVDQESVEGGFAEPEDIGKTFVSIAHPKAVASLSYQEVEEEKKASKAKKVSK